LVHADLVGPIKPQTIGGKGYALMLLDDATRWQWQYLLRAKSDAAKSFEEWLATTEKSSPLASS